MILRSTAIILCLACVALRADIAGKMPLSFEANQGQTDARVQFLSRGNARTLFLTSTEAVLRAGHDVFRMQIEGANARSKAEGAEPQAARSNYFIGNDSAKWRMGVANYGRVRFIEVYPGIDLVYYGRDRRLEYDWIVKPGADPATIRLKFRGVTRVRVDRNGDLVLQTPGGEIREKKPVIYQDKEIAGHYVVRGRHEAGFAVGPYDHAKTLVIDPVLVYSSYLGGSGSDQGNAIAVDSTGNAYVTGWTGSTDFPTVNPAHSVNQGSTLAGNACGCDVFVSKVSANGSTLLYSTYLGGNGDDFGQGVAVDANGDAFVTGWTRSTDFPVASAFQSTYGSLVRSYTGFVTKLSPSGGVLFSTYLGGDYTDLPHAIAVDTSGNPYITGYTDSSNFPTVNAMQPGPNPHDDGFAFLTKMTADGSALSYSTYLGAGGSNISAGRAIAVDSSGNAYVTGYTSTPAFPTFHPLQSTFTGPQGVFVAKINPSGAAFIYSTFLDGSGTDQANAIAADAAGNTYITGWTTSSNFPLAHPITGTPGGSSDGFVTKINPTGSALVYSTLLGGNSADTPFGIAVNAAGEAWVAGVTASSNFPIVNPLPGSKHIASDLFISRLSADGSFLSFSSYAGVVGQYLSSGQAGGIFRAGLALDSSGNAYITDSISASNFPIVNPFQAVFGGGSQDAVVLKVSGSSAADFDANEEPDTVLQFPDGSMGVWYLGNNGGQITILGFAFLAGPSSGITLVDVADINSDGVPDLILQFPDGSMGVWYMGGPQRTTITGFAFISGPIQGWKPVGIADLNGDGHSDLIIQNLNGTIGVWYLGGALGNQIQGYAPISGPIAGWKVVGVADLNNDGHPDAIIQYTDGTVGVWYLGGAQGNQIQSFALIAGASGWSVTGVAEMNHDGHLDLMIRNADGTLGIWYLGGTQGNQIIGFAPVTTPGNVNWKEMTAH